MMWSIIFHIFPKSKYNAQIGLISKVSENMLTFIEGNTN